MTFKAHVLDEPMLEFGDGGQHCDPRQGLREHGPLQPRSGDVIRVGVIGTDDTVAGFTEFLGETGRGIESGNKQLINLNPDFPGLGNQNPFRCKFEVPDGATVTISRRQVNEITGIRPHCNLGMRSMPRLGYICRHMCPTLPTVFQLLDGAIKADYPLIAPCCPTKIRLFGAV